MKKKVMSISILIGLIVAVIYVLVNIHSFQTYKYTLEKVIEEAKQDSSNDRYIIKELKSETFKEANYSNSSIKELTYEEFIVNESLIAIDAEAIPYLKYTREPKEGDKNDEEEVKLKKEQDATLEVDEYDKLNKDKEVRRYKIGKILYYKKSFDKQQNMPNVDNPYGNTGKIVAKSRTIAKYKSASSINLSAGEAWIAAHERTLSKNLTDYSKARIDKVQSAMWKFKNVKDTEGNFGSNIVAENVANNLHQEAKWMEASIAKRSNLDTLMKDNMINKYSIGGAGIVTYNEITKEFLVGPFSVNYIRDVHQALNGGLSEMIGSKQGAGNLIIYSGVVGANVYALVNGKETLLTDWEFVYPDVIENNGKVKRKAIVNAGESGDINDNIYPYPNEEFYIKFLNPNNSIEAITKLEFNMQTLNAEGRAQRIKGTYNNINWRVQQNWGKTLTRPSYSEDKGHMVEQGYFVTNPDGTETWVDTSYWKPNIVEHPNLYTYTYEAWVEDELVSNMSAATLYQVANAKIYTKTESVKIKVGNKHSDYKYIDYCIPLTMNIGGTVWIDGNEENEVIGRVNGLKESGEEKKPGVIVKLYNNFTGEIVETVTTNNEGKYLFKYVQVGPKYYVEFEYDWMKYKATYDLCKSGSRGDVRDFTENPENYLNSSHVKESKSKRKSFNQSFYEITTDKGIDKNGNVTRKIDYEYMQKVEPYYQVATVGEFNETSNTKDCGILLPLQTKYAIAKGGDKFLTVGIGEDGVSAITKKEKDETLQYRYEAGKFMKVQEYLENINLGLVERTPADFALKSDIVSTTLTINEAYSNQNVNFGARRDLGIDVLDRESEYFEKQYEQEISVENYNWRHDFTESSISTEEDELQVYVLYEYVIENQSPLISGYITELSSYYDNEYMYPVGNDKESKNFYLGNSLYKDSATQFMKYPSYIMKDNEIIKQVEWKAISKFNDNNNTNINKMYTESLNDVLLAPGEKVSVFVYYKVNREELNINTPTEYKYGKYVILDNETNGKKNIVEINAYRGLDYVEKDVDKSPLANIGGSRVDKDSNPGNIDSNAEYISNFKYYEDDTDYSPMLRIEVNKSNGKEISGFVWEDMRTEKLANNQLIGNSKKDEEVYINNILVELIRLEYNPELDIYEEVKFSSNYEKFVNTYNNNIKENYGAQYANGEISLIKIKRRTGPQDEPESLQNTTAYIKDGQYVFGNLIESGQYKVRFTYGDEEQLKTGANGIKYNGHDYKSTEIRGLYEQSLLETMLENVNMENTADIKILTMNANYKIYANDLAKKLYNAKGKFEIENKVIGTNVLEIESAIDSLIGSDKTAKALVLLVDSTLNNITDLLKKALDNDIMVIIVATNNVNGTFYNIKSNNKFVIYYDTLNNTLTLNEVYNRIISSILDKNMFVNIYNQSTDFINNQLTVNGNVYGRVDVMLKSQILDYNVAEVLAIKEIINMLDGEKKEELLKKLSEFKMSAESYPVSLKFNDNENVKYISLGLQEIPKSSLELSKEVDNLIVTLADGKEIINLKDKNVKNVQHFINNSYNIYMDEEIMQGATIRVTYKISITNLSEVDNLMTYLKYYSFDTKKNMYERLGGSTEGLTEQQLDDILSKSITVKVNAIYDYYDNLIFRAEENNRQSVNTNNFKIQSLNNKETTLERDKYGRLNLTFNQYLKNNVVWAPINDARDYAIRESIKKEINGFKCVSTTNLNNIDLYPYESIEVKDNQSCSSISTYITFSKTLSARDFMNAGSLEYRNYAEIIETYSLNGRRSNNSIQGNFNPNKYKQEKLTDELDSDAAEIVKILVPFGATLYIAFGAIIVILIGIGSCIYIIKKKYNI